MRHFEISRRWRLLAATAACMSLASLAIALEAGDGLVDPGVDVTPELTASAVEPTDESPVSAESPPVVPSAPRTAPQRPQRQSPKRLSSRLAPTPRDADTPDELLDVFGLEQEKFAAFRDGRNLEDDSTSLALLHRILYRLPNMPLDSLDRWAEADVDLSQWRADSTSQRRRFFALSGRIRRLELVKMTEKQELLWTFAEYYRCHVSLGDANVPAIVYAREVPQAWKLNEELDESVSFKGLFLGEGRADAGQATMPLLFAVDRLAWHTDSLLGNAGMDVGLFDTVHSGRKLHSADRECFYQLLNAVGTIRQDTLVAKADARVFGRHATLTKQFAELQKRQAEVQQALQAMTANDAGRKKLRHKLSRIERDLIITETAINTTAKGYSDFISVLEKPSNYSGQLLRFRGTALRILRVPLGAGDRDVLLRFGIDHYYEIDAIVSLDLDIQVTAPQPIADEADKSDADKSEADKVAGAGDESRISSSEGTASAEGKSETSPKAKPAKPRPLQKMSRYPVTFCVRTLPKGMPTGATVNEPIQIIGFHMKNWKYPTMEGAGGEATYRTAPMLIGRMPLHLEPSVMANPTYALIAGILFTVALAVVWISIWLLGRGDRAFEEATMSSRFALEEGASLDRLDVPATDEPSEPDFSRLAEIDSHRADTDES